jgi:hypothetical protein
MRDKPRANGASNSERASDIASESARDEDINGVAVEDRDSFRMNSSNNLRHFVAHAEYGVVFSLCGMRVSKNLMQYDPEAIPGEIVCDKCKKYLHLSQFTDAMQNVEAAERKAAREKAEAAEAEASK